ncbi:MAG: ABC transporter permease [Candidatus Acidiferrales bacterium]
MQSLMQDLKYGIRTLARSPGFSIIAVFTLALGIGANTAIFSVINATLLARLPYKQPDRIVMVWESNRARGFPHNTVSPGNFLYWQDGNTVFDRLAAFVDVRANLTGSGEPEQIPGQVVTPNLFPLLGVNARIGRTFVSEEGQPGKDDVALLSYGLWQRRFGGDPKIVGKKILLGGKSTEVVGVMPPGFQLLIQQSSFTGEHAQFWSPLAFTAEQRVPVGRYLTAVGRLKPGVTLAQAQSQMDSIAGDLAKRFPEMDTGWGVQLVSLHDQFFRSIRQALLILLGAVGFVLLIACANVANLLLSRASRRRRELAIRFTMGASRGRIVRQLFTETMILAVAGGVAGVLLAYWGTDLLLALSPKGLLDAQSVSVDFRVLGFVAALTIFTGALFGLVPALVAARTNPGSSLKEGERNTGITVRGMRLRSLLVIGEISLALILLAGSGLLIKSFLRLEAVSPGFDAQNLLTVKVDLPSHRYSKDPEVTAFFAELLQRVKTLPGVESASANSSLPFTGAGSGTSFTIEGRPVALAGENLLTEVCVIKPDYFRTMRIPLERGREFTGREDAQESHVVIVSESLVRKYLPTEDPLGKKITIDMKDLNVPSEIVGVVGDIKQYGLDTAARVTVYWPHPELAYNSMTLVVRSKADPAQLAGSIRAIVQSLDPDLPISEVRTMEDWMGDSVAQARFNTLVLGIFSAIALLLAIIGIYGVMSATITERTQEIGIRMALGALPRDIWRQVLQAGAIIAIAGLGAGLAASFALTRLLASLLFNVKPDDPLTFAIVTALLATVALLACYVPARRAMRVDPMVALRYE